MQDKTYYIPVIQTRNLYSLNPSNFLKVNFPSDLCNYKLSNSNYWSLSELCLLTIVYLKFYLAVREDVIELVIWYYSKNKNILHH